MERASFDAKEIVLALIQAVPMRILHATMAIDGTHSPSDGFAKRGVKPG
jgi:hypothetical protein